MSKLWSGRFGTETDKLTEELNASIGFDARLYRHDIIGSTAHAKMLHSIGVITEEELSAIIGGLNSVGRDIEAGTLKFSASDEDIHMAIESELTRRIGQAGKKLHTARSRNDQVAVDFRMYCMDETEIIREHLLTLVRVLCGIISKHLNTVMPGYTHLQRAQPTTLAHHMSAYAQMFTRDITRLEDWRERTNYCPLGAGALTTTTYPIDREMTASLLGFNAPAENSIDAVSDRDYAIELVSCLSILFMHLSRFSEEIILWCSGEFGFITLSDAFATGSSIMPQKKNPDIAELVRGKTGRVYGDLMSMLTMMKGLPLAYNKDMQEDKERVFDALDTAKLCLPAFTAMLDTMTVNVDRMRKSASEGFINATDCADYLVKQGIAFRDAYTIVGKLVAHCEKSGKTLETLSLDEYQAYCDKFDSDIFGAINLENCVKSRKVFGGPAPDEVKRGLTVIEAFTARREDETNG